MNKLPWRIHVCLGFPDDKVGTWWVWRLTINGNPIADSRRSYSTRDECLGAVLPLAAALEAEISLVTIT